MSTTVLQLMAKIGVDTKDLEDGVGRSHSAVGGFMESFGAFAAADLAIEGMRFAFDKLKDGISAVATAGWGFDSQMEHLHAQLKAITGSGQEADKILDWVKKFGQTVPDTTEHLAQATVTVQSLGINAESVM